MVYKRKYYRRRRRTYKRYGYFGKFGRDAGSAWKMAKKALSLINVEYKYLDVTAGSQNMTGTPTIVLLNGCQTGDTATTRDGQSILLKSIYCQFMVYMDPSSTTYNIVRFMLVLDTQPNATVMSAADLFQNNTSGTNVVSPININYGKRFKVLYDKRFSLNATQIREKVWKYFKRLKFHTKFNTGNAGTIADITSNALYLVFVNDNNVTTPDCQYYVRLRFIDN